VDLATSKDPGPEEPGFGSIPERGRCVTELISTFYWSVGVLENRTHDRHLPGIKPEIDGILFPWNPRALDHYSNTPPLPGFFKAEPSACDLAQKSRISSLN
jgi:hypothetical protein